MEMDEYQHLASGYRCGEPSVVFAALGVAGEAGEVADKVKKAIRDNNGTSMTRRLKRVLSMSLAMCFGMSRLLRKTSDLHLAKSVNPILQNWRTGVGAA